MSKRDSLHRTNHSGEVGNPTPHAEHFPVRKSRWLLKSCCRAKPPRRLILFTLALTTLFAFLAWREAGKKDSQNTRANLPGNAFAMALFLRDRLPGARIVSTRADGVIDRNFLLTFHDWDKDTLRRLPRISDRTAEWRGTVLCEWQVDQQTAKLNKELWGENAFEQPPFVFFGDKKLLARIKEILR